MKYYAIGHTVEATATFRDRDKVLFSPANVEAMVKTPTGVVSGPAPSELSEGIFLVQIPTDESGVWYLRVEGTDGPVVRAEETSFCVKPTSVVV